MMTTDGRMRSRAAKSRSGRLREAIGERSLRVRVDALLQNPNYATLRVDEPEIVFSKGSWTF